MSTNAARRIIFRQTNFRSHIVSVQQRLRFNRFQTRAQHTILLKERTVILPAIVICILTASVTFAATRALSSPESQPGEKPILNSPQYGNGDELIKAISEIRKRLGAESVSEDNEELQRYGFSEWSTTNAERLPSAIVYPRSTEQVSSIAKICKKYRIPLVPYSAGSSLEGNFSSPLGGINVNFMLMDEIIAFHPDDMDVVVQPGVPWMDLNDKIKHEGLFFPVDPGPTAQIGGMVGTGGSGTNSVRYGTMRDWVVNLTVVLADGTIIKTRSEGTLGIVTEITLRLAVIPKETSVAVASFPTIKAAAATAMAVMRNGVPIGAMEIMDDVQMQIVNASGFTGKKWDEVPTMFFRFSGTETGVKDNIAIVKQLATENGCQSFDFAVDENEKQSLWSARKEALWATLAMKKHESEVFWGTDVAVPLSRLPDLIETTKRDLQELGLFGAALGHIGDGNFHTSLLYRKDLPEERKAVEDFVHQMVDRALELDGTCTGEHGIGIGKKKELVDELGVETVTTMKLIKNALDPNWILNPVIADTVAAVH